jgi:cellulose biosynthesis protein BcsQ
MKMVTINFYSYKGGVGRTVLMAQVARCLAALGKKVVIVDFDFDAPGALAAFNKNFDEAEGGLYNLVNKFKHINRSDRKDYEEFKTQLSRYLIDIEIQLNGTPRGTGMGTGFIKILPSGRVNNAYWNNIADIEWLQILASNKENYSFVSFVQQILKPVLEEMDLDYLVIDSRAGITYYGSIARCIADVQTMIVCPNAEAEQALRTFLIPAFCTNVANLDRLIFIVSRMPIELIKQRNKIFEEMTMLMEEAMPTRIFGRMKILKLHSDIETHFGSQFRVLDEKFLLPIDERPFVVQIHEDILIILAALCPELYINLPVNSLEEGARALWEKIYGYSFEITREERIFRLFDVSGEMKNIDDEERNVAFKVDTFLNFLRDFHKTLDEEFGDSKKAKNVMGTALANAGKRCGTDFGTALDIQLIAGGIEKQDYKSKIIRWCEFDTRAGFGLMSYDGKFLEIKNPFIQDKAYMAFITGYVTGVLEQLMDWDTTNILDGNFIGNGIQYKVEA